MSSSADYEPLLNGKLGDLLLGLGFDALAEGKQEGSRKQIDVMVRQGHLVIALEAEINSRSGAIRDAQARLDQAEADQVVADVAVAVNYPANLHKEDFANTTTIEWTVLPNQKFVRGTVDTLAQTLRRIPEDFGDPDNLAAILKASLESAVVRLNGNQMRELAEALNLPLEAKVDGKRRDTGIAAAKRGLLVVAAAAMFHCQLDGYLYEMQPGIDARTGQPYSGEWPPQKLHQCLTEDDVIGALYDAWQLILAKNYRSIFEAACVALHATQGSSWNKSVRTVARASQRVSADAASARHDLLGRIFHELLNNARYDGSFYTSTSAATLLAALAIREQDLPADLSQFRVIDPACGTGTLLMAAAERIRDLRGLETSDRDTATLIEDVIWGIDVNITACHMAATTLGLLSPAITFKEMNVFMAPLSAMPGPGRGAVTIWDCKAGSLEFLEGGTQLDRYGYHQGRLLSEFGEQVDSGTQVEIEAYSYGLVIMNPPYTRDSLRHDQFSKEEEKALKDREEYLLRGRAADLTSYGSMFCDLGEHLCNLDKGTLALVYPLTGAAASSALKVRKLLAQWFHIEWVIYSHDPKRPWFSENTTIDEMLIVARRPDTTHKVRQKPPTKFVCLRRNSQQTTDATALATALREGTLDPAIGTISEWPAERMSVGEWRPLGITSAYLTELSQRIASGALFSVEPLGRLSHIGPHGRRVHDAFTKNMTSDSEGRQALWYNDTRIMRSLKATPDVYIHAIPGKDYLADKYWTMRSRLLICRFPRLNTLRVVSVWSSNPVLGNNWIPVQPPPGLNEQWEKAISVWMNSTLGVVSIMSIASPKLVSRPDMSLDACRRLPVPTLDIDQSETLAKAFDAYAETEFGQLFDAHTDKARHALDTIVCQTLEIPYEAVQLARSELCKEPAIAK